MFEQLVFSLQLSAIISRGGFGAVSSGLQQSVQFSVVWAEFSHLAGLVLFLLSRGLKLILYKLNSGFNCKEI